MQGSKASYSGKMAVVIFGIIFVVYNVLLFIISGFEDHGPSFWISYVFMLVAFAVLGVSSFILSRRSNQPRDWLLGYPILRQGVIYLVVEFFLSMIFMLLDGIDCPWEITVVVQLIVLAVFMIFIVGNFMAKGTIEGVQENVKQKTSYMRMLQADLEIMAMKAVSPDVKQAYSKLAEQVRYSDPMSSDALSMVEGQMAQLAAQANNCIATNNNEGALQICSQLTLLLAERNKKCMALK